MFYKRWMTRLAIENRRLLDFFKLTPQYYEDQRALLQGQLIFYFVLCYLAAWAVHIPMYVILGNYAAATLVILLGLSSAALGVVCLRYHKNRLAALSANLGGLTTLLAITMVTGGNHSPIPAWLFFGTMTTFLLLNVRAGWYMTAYILTALVAIFVIHNLELINVNRFPFAIDSLGFTGFTLFVYITSIISLSIVTNIYDDLQRKGFNELHLALDKIREQRNDMLAMLNNVQQGILTILADGSIHHQYSAYLINILGTNNIAGRRIEEVLLNHTNMSAEQKDHTLFIIRSVLGHCPTADGPHCAQLFRDCEIVDNDGRHKTIEFEWVPIPDKNNKIYKILVTLRDVTHERALQAQALADQHQKNNQAKMAALGEMAAGMAHEINNPLAVISGRAQEIQMCLEFGRLTDDILMRAADNIVRHSNRISNIIQSMLNFSRQKDDDIYTAIDTELLITDTLELCSENIRQSQITFELKKSEPAKMLGNQSRMMQVILNLLSNAIYAVNHGTCRSKQITIGWKKNSQTVLLLVHDNGDGIAPEIREQVMKPFFTTKPSGQGTGLGLSISKELVNKMGGNIWFDSHPQGTTFFVEMILA